MHRAVGTPYGTTEPLDTVQGGGRASAHTAGMGSGNGVKVGGQVSGTQGVAVAVDGREKAVGAGAVPAGGRGPDPELRPRAGRR